MEKEIKGKIQANIQSTMIEVVDESSMHGSTNSHFRVFIVSDDFKGMTTLQRHQKVHQSIGLDLIGKIHAFSQQTLTKEEWKEKDERLSSPPCHKKQNT